LGHRSVHLSLNLATAEVLSPVGNLSGKRGIPHLLVKELEDPEPSFPLGCLNVTHQFPHALAVDGVEALVLLDRRLHASLKDRAAAILAPRHEMPRVGSVLHLLVNHLQNAKPPMPLCLLQL